MKAGKIKIKKAVSEVVSYVLLIVIAMSLAAGVYAWMHFYVPSEKEEKCPDETAISITNAECPAAGLGQPRKLVLTIQNQGLFEVEGFFILASEDIARPPYQPLNDTRAADPNSPPRDPGRYNFFPSKLAPGTSASAEFYYPSNFNSIKRVKVQPFKSSSLNATLLCPFTAETRVDC